MPKKPPALCMFCNNAPCTCGDSVTQRSARKPKPSPRERSSPPDAVPETSAEGGDDSYFTEEVIPSKERTFKVHAKAERDLSFEAAERCLLLAGILHPSDAALVRERLDPPKNQDIDRRTAEWRERHG